MDRGGARRSAMTTPVMPMPATPSIDALTPRQREVIELVARGLSNDDIAGVLGVSATTVRTHVSGVLRTLDVANRTEATALYASWTQGPARTDAVLARPALAILPIVAIDDDPRLRTMASGISYDLAAMFARWSWFPVVFDPPAPVAPADGSALAASAARFRFTGSLRRHGAGLRLTVSVDEADGGRLWTDRYELALGELFEIEDVICGSIVAAAYPVLVAHTLADLGRFPAAVPTELPAWEHAHRAMALQQRREIKANGLAQAAFHAALERDPRLVLAHYGLGLAAYDELLHQWGDRRAALARLRACAERCLALAPHAAEGHFLLGRIHHVHSAYAEAIGPLETAIQLNPSYAPAHALLAQFLVLEGRLDEGRARVRYAMKLSPRSQVTGLAVVNFVCGHYQDSLDAAETALTSHPEYPFARALAAVSALRHGDRDRALGHHAALYRLAPGFTPATFLASFGPNVPGVTRFVDALETLAALATGRPARANPDVG